MAKLFYFMTIIILFKISHSIDDFNITCGNSTCLYGSCYSVRESLCSCNDSYDTYSVDYSQVQCSYQRKKQTIALLLELILMFGIGHFYLGRSLIGVLKFLLFSIGVSLIVALRIHSKTKEQYNPISLRIAYIGYTVFLAMVSWEFIDILMFLLNKYKDGNNIDLLGF